MSDLNGGEVGPKVAIEIGDGKLICGWRRRNQPGLRASGRRISRGCKAQDDAEECPCVAYDCRPTALQLMPCFRPSGHSHLEAIRQTFDHPA